MGTRAGRGGTGRPARLKGLGAVMEADVVPRKAPRREAPGPAHLRQEALPPAPPRLGGPLAALLLFLPRKSQGAL